MFNWKYSPFCLFFLGAALVLGGLAARLEHESSAYRVLQVSCVAVLAIGVAPVVILAIRNVLIAETTWLTVKAITPIVTLSGSLWLMWTRGLYIVSHTGLQWQLAHPNIGFAMFYGSLIIVLLLNWLVMFVCWRGRGKTAVDLRIIDSRAVPSPLDDPTSRPWELQG